MGTGRQMREGRAYLLVFAFLVHARPKFKPASSIPGPMNRSKTFNFLSRGRGSPVERQFLLLKLLLVGGVVLSLGAFFFVRHAEMQSTQADFKLLASAHKVTLQKEIQLNLEAIEYLHGLYRSSDFVSREEFGSFARGPLFKHQALLELAWVPRVSHEVHAAFERQPPADFGHMVGKPFSASDKHERLPEQSEYFPIEYLESMGRSLHQIGFDLASEPMYRQAMAQALETGETVISQRLPLNEEGGLYGVLALKPVFSSAKPLGDLEERRAELQGFLVGVIDISTLVGEAVVSWGIFDLNILMLDATAPASERVLFHYDTKLDHEHHSDGEVVATRGDFQWRALLEVPGREWYLVFQPGAAFVSAHNTWEPWLTLAGGLLLTSLLCMLQLGSIRRTREVESLAADLVEVNAKLEKQIAQRRRVEEAVKRSRKMLQLVLDTIPVRVFWKGRDFKYLGCNQRFAEDAGMSNPQEIVGKDDYQLVWREYADLYREDDRQVMESGQAKLNFEEPQIGPDGRKLWLRTSKIPLTDMDNNIIGVLGTYEDITQQKEAEEALRRQTDEKERIERVLVEVANAVSSSTGDEFFRILAKNLARTLDMDVAFIAAFCSEDTSKGEMLAVCMDGEITSNFCYATRGTPCELALAENGYCIPDGLPERFPHCTEMMGMDMELVSYLGMPLFDTEGQILGLAAVMSRRPMEDHQVAESILRIFANRMAAELSHKQAATEIADLIKFPIGNPSPVLRVRSDGRLIFANQGAQFLLEHWGCRVNEPVPEEILHHCAEALACEQNVEVDIPCGDREYSFMFTPSAADQYVSIYAFDITERQRARAEMLKLTRAVEQTADSICITDAQGIIEYVNPAFEKTTGYTREEVLGQTPRLFKSGRHEPEFYEHMWQTLLSGQVYRDVMINRRKDGSLYYEEKSITPLLDDAGRITHFISTGKDITERMQAEERLHHLAYHDVLTDLPNRALFMDRLSHALSRRRAEGSRVALMFLDVDRFKTINDTLGHDTGDRLLQAFARLLTRCVREGDTVSRFGGDEFAILLEDVPSVQAVSQVADKIRAALAKPFKVEGPDLYVTTSIGISLCPDDGRDAATMLKHADAAMYRAKERGRNNYQFYATDMGEAAMERLTLESGLRQALPEEKFHLVYQPQVEVRGKALLGMEALLRWQHPELGPVNPAQFIPILEETGLITEVGHWVLRTACRHAARWNELLGRPLHIAINISGRQFHDPELNIQVARVLEETGIPAHLLELEITESVLMQHNHASLSNLEALHRMGVRLAIDDFGTGYSSLSYLKRFPVDSLKIDRTFIRDITTDPDDATIVSAITAMAHRLNMRVTAEGVETEEQLEFLRRCDCDAMQGYLFSEPLLAEEVEEFLIARGLCTRSRRAGKRS